MKYTEARLLAALRDRYTVPGNGGSGRYAFLTHVRTGAAWDQREIDAVVVCLWPSEHFDLHAFETKVSRGDWLREIQDRRGPDGVVASTDKSERTRSLADTFTIVAPRGVVRDGELPAGWGLIEADTLDGETVRLTSVVRAKPLRPREHELARVFPRGLVVAMLRAAGAVPGMRTGRKRKPLEATDEEDG